MSDKCQNTNRYLETSEFTNGEIWTDGAGVMARPCYRDAAGALYCVSDWCFIQRSSF